MWTTQDVPGVGAYVYRVRPTQNLQREKTTGNGIGCYLKMVFVSYRKKWERSLMDEGKHLGEKNVGSIRWAGIPIMPWSQK